MSSTSQHNSLKPWFFGLFASLVTLIGLKLAAHDAESQMYTVGLLIAGAGIACIIYTINSAFSR